MTKIITTLEDRVEQVIGIPGRMVRYTEGKEAPTNDFGDILQMLIPSDRHRLLTLGNWRPHRLLSPRSPDGWPVAWTAKRNAGLSAARCS